ncbi:expressed protein [Phakopsora pachyrhizi]|uniref:Expressed protein n=1 Tax=Phakopsora pachyrhizi TaxID=170000 RepID=A0AAV0AV98_PHAPC|nr:expressed protein [Phakopsora pachyrhizi]
MLKFRFPTNRNNRQHQQQSNTTNTTTSNNNNNSSSLQSPSSSTSFNNQLQSNKLSDSIDSPPNSSSSSPSSNSSSSKSLKRPNLPFTMNHFQEQSPHQLFNPPIIVSRKTRRKSYGGLRAILGINKQEELPPVPSIDPNQSYHQNHPLNYHQSHPSIDASTSPSSSFTSIPPPSPNTTESRPSTSSLRPFPFLSGIRRKSANSNASKPTPQIIHNPNFVITGPSANSPSTLATTDPRSAVPTDPSLRHKHDDSQASVEIPSSSASSSHRFYTHGSSKKAQSVDDLSQFGLLPKPRIQPRRSEELFEMRQGGCKSSEPALSSVTEGIDLHQGLDQIGELAGSLARITSGSDKSEDRQPRLSNPKGMRTVYGVPIEDLYWRDGDLYPLLVNVLVKLIEEKGLDQQGIYRVPGEKRVIENLQASIDEKGVNGVDIWKDSYKDVHNLSGVLKLFLREIPGGVIPFDRYDEFLAVSAIQNEEERTVELQKQVKELPIPNLILLLRLIRHFEKVVEHAEVNSMLVHNVAIVFAPSLFRSGSEHSNPLLSMQNIGKASALVRHLVLNANMVFGDPSEEDQLTIGRSVGRGKRIENESESTGPPQSSDSTQSNLSSTKDVLRSKRMNSSEAMMISSLSIGGGGNGNKSCDVEQQHFKSHNKKKNRKNQQNLNRSDEKEVEKSSSSNNFSKSNSKNRVSLSGVSGGNTFGLKKKK